MFVALDATPLFYMAFWAVMFVVLARWCFSRGNMLDFGASYFRINDFVWGDHYCFSGGSSWL